MAADCCDHRDSSDPHRGNPTYRRVLWAVLAINAVMFAVEIGAATDRRASCFGVARSPEPRGAAHAAPMPPCAELVKRGPGPAR